MVLLITGHWPLKDDSSDKIYYLYQISGISANAPLNFISYKFIQIAFPLVPIPLKRYSIF